MDNADASPSFDRWGEPLPEGPSAGGPKVKAVRRRWWVLVAVGLLLLVVGSYFVAKRGITRSLSASCREALRAGDWQRLEPLATRWHWWEPDLAAPLIYLAEAAQQTHQQERAAKLLGQLPDGDPMTPPALVERSGLLFGPLNRPIEGAHTLERALRLNPRLAVARQRLIYFYAFTLQRRKMVDQVYQAIRYDCDLPESYVYLMAQDWLSFANAYAENTKWLRGNPDEELFLVARAIYRITSRGLNDTEDPRQVGPRDPKGLLRHQKLIAEYCRRFPQNVELLVYLLERARVTGDVEEMARVLSRAPPQAAADNRFWRYKGWLYATRGELVKAEECYQKALALNCYDHVSRHQLAGVERRFKRLDQVKALEKVSREGWQLRHEILQLESVDKVPPDILRQMAQYAKDCGDDDVAGKLLLRLEKGPGRGNPVAGAF